MSSSTASWICKELSQLLGFSATEDVADYLMSMENSRDVEDYLQSMLDLANPEHRRFVEQLLNRLGHSQSTLVSHRSEQHVKGQRQQAPLGKSEQQRQQAPLGKSEQQRQQAPISKPEQQLQPKKRVKQINLFSKEGQARESVTIPGQHRCECQASKHALIRNCLDCGRVICAQEGPGPCLFCTFNEPKGSAADEKAPAKKSGKSKKGSGPKFLEGTTPLPDKAFTTALAHKERLLEFDRTSEHRTRVIDDESDYFNADGNKWLAPKQRDMLRARERELRDRRHGSKRAIKVTLDFAGRQVIEEQSNFDELFTEQQFEEESKEYYDQYAVNPLLTFPRPIYESSVEDASKSSHPAMKANEVDAKIRVQDAELQKMSDPGKCMSMHQPYASLLTAGIKQHEGRTWYSSHRGRLWIASTVKEPSPEEVQELEAFYRAHYGRDDLVFPKHYPTGCLLGCVEVSDVLPQEEYRRQHPNGESESPFVFICENPNELFVKIPNRGQHKIYKLDAGIHQTAKKSLRF